MATEEFDVWEHLWRIQESQKTPGVQVTPGEFDVELAWINYGKENHEYPIASEILRFSITEDMEAFGLTGWLEMKDPKNLVQNGPIVGQELLYISFHTRGTKELSNSKRFAMDFTKQPLWIYKVEDMIQDKTIAGGRAPQSLSYRLHFCSPEILRNERVRISQSLDGSYSEIVQNILKNHLKTTKPITLEKTTDLKHVVVPNMHPLQVIDWMTSSSETNLSTTRPPRRGNPHRDQPPPNPFKGRSADYYFYETPTGYKFRPALREPGTTITLALGNAPMTAQYVNQMTTASEWEIIQNADTRHSAKGGMWGSKRIVHDHYNKSVKTYQSNYHRSIKKDQYAYVSKTPVFNPTNISEKNKDAKDKTISDFPDSLLMVSSVSGKTNSNVDKQTNKINYPWSITPPDLAMRRQMQINHACNYNVLRAKFPGISSLHAGMIVQLTMAQIGVGSGQIDDSVPIFPNKLENRWIIKQITHVVNRLPSEAYYHCDVLLTNTLLDSPSKSTLPAYEGMGSEQKRFKTPTSSKVGSVNPHTGESEVEGEQDANET